MYFWGNEMRVINKAIKIIITIVLAIGLLIGSFYGILYLDATLKKVEHGEILIITENNYVEVASQYGYYIPPSVIKCGSEQDSALTISWKIKDNRKVNINNGIFYTYYKKTQNEAGIYEYFFDQLNNGIYSLWIDVFTNPIVTWEQEVFRERNIKRNSPRHTAHQYTFIKVDIEGADSMGYVSVIKTYPFEQYEFIMNMESRISKDCHVHAEVKWIIDINNYDYEAMKQTALDYMAYIIRNVQPHIV